MFYKCVLLFNFWVCSWAPYCRVEGHHCRWVPSTDISCSLVQKGEIKVIPFYLAFLVVFLFHSKRWNSVESSKALQSDRHFPFSQEAKVKSFCRQKEPQLNRAAHAQWRGSSTSACGFSGSSCACQKPACSQRTFCIACRAGWQPETVGVHKELFLHQSHDRTLSHRYCKRFERWICEGKIRHRWHTSFPNHRQTWSSTVPTTWKHKTNSEDPQTLRSWSHSAFQVSGFERKSAEAAGSVLPCQPFGLVLFTYTAVPVFAPACGGYFTCLN